MIIPCMNSTSARDIGGRDAWVSAGRVFVGSPGAPGCTTDGPPLAFWAPATGETGSRITAAVTTPAPRRQARQIVLVAGKPLISVLLRYHALRTTEQRDLLPLPRTALRKGRPRLPDVLWFGFLPPLRLPTRDAPNSVRGYRFKYKAWVEASVERFNPHAKSPPQWWAFC